jgi:ketosteroid isomerase-like protein
MAADDVALVRALLRAPSVDAFYEGLDDDVEWDVRRAPDAATVIHGREAVRSFMQRWRHGWERWSFGDDDFLDAGDRVVTIAAASGVDPRPAAVWTVRAGKVVRFIWYERARDALEDAGLSRPTS